MALVLRSLFRMFSKIILRYLYQSTISSFIVHLDCPESVPLSPEISYHLFNPVHIHVKLRLITSFCEVTEGCTVTVLCFHQV